MAEVRHTDPGDLVLILSAGEAAGFARVEAIRPHELDGWFHCDLLLLAVPPRPITWILEREQIDGTEFTMSGQPIRLERLPDLGASHADESVAQDEPPESAAPADATPPGGPVPAGESGAAGRAKVVELFPGRKGADDS